MEVLDPVEGGGDKEGLHLGSAYVETASAPFGVLLPIPALIFVKRRAVKLVQTVLVLGEVRRHPVQNHADAVGVELVHEVAEVLGRTEAGGGRKVAAALIAPAAVEGIFSDREQLHVGVAHLLHVGHQQIGDLAVVQICITIHVGLAVTGTPRGKVHLVDVERCAVELPGVGEAAALGHPRAVGPAEVIFGIDQRSGLLQGFVHHGVRIRLVADAVFALDAVFVGLPFQIGGLYLHFHFPHTHIGDAG